MPALSDKMIKPVFNNISNDNSGHRLRLQKRFLSSGEYQELPDYELLELVLMKAIPRKDVKPLAKRLIAHFGNFSRLFKASDEELLSIEGIGPATVALFKAVLETNRRILDSELKHEPALDCWEKLLDFCFLQLQDVRVEKFLVLYLDSRKQLIRNDMPQTGGKDRVTLYPDEILRKAVLLRSDHIFVAHNHPSGWVEPSHSDCNITMELFNRLKASRINLVDHIIIGTQRQYFSFLQKGRLSGKPEIVFGRTENNTPEKVITL